MGKNRDNKMTRKQFLKITSTGVLGMGIWGRASRTLAGIEDGQAQETLIYRHLGRTGIRVTPVGYGATRTMESSLIQRGLESGINFIDTGRRYFNGQHEAMIGKVIKDFSGDIIVQSKMPIRPKEKGKALHTDEMRKKLRSWMETLLDQSLKALQRDYVDIMLLHGVDREEILNHETVRAFFTEAKTKGKIRACGFSSHKNHVALVRNANQTRFYDVVMVPYNHKGAYTHSRAGYYSEWDQAALEEQLRKAEEKGLGVVAMKTCSGGPYAPDGQQNPTYKDALKWILGHSYISTMAVAMGSHKEISEDLQAMS